MTGTRRYKNINIAAVAIAAAASFTFYSCKDDDVDETEVWRLANEEYVTLKADEKQNGKAVYEKVSPDWAPEAFVLMKWHNDRNATASNLQPLDNSTVNVKYEFEDIEGTQIQNSYASTAYGDSIYQCKPCDNIIGFWTALRQMHVGDSVTVIIPASAGYGATGVNAIKPYSTLIYHMKLKEIVAYEIPLK